MPRMFRCAVLAAALIVGVCLRADTDVDAELQYQLGSVLLDDSRYREAVEAFERAAKTDDAALVMRARKGKFRAALRIAAFGIAQETAETLYAQPNVDAEGIALYGDALWASGRFDDADVAYRRAVERTPGSAPALSWTARTLSTGRRR